MKRFLYKSKNIEPWDDHHVTRGVIRRFLIRVGCLAYIAAFFLPFVTERGCAKSSGIRTLTGIELLMSDGGRLYAVAFVAIVIILVLTLLTFNHCVIDSLLTFQAGCRALCAGVACFIAAFLPGFQFFFSVVQPLTGQKVAVASSAALWLEGIATAVLGCCAMKGEKGFNFMRNRALERFHLVGLMVSLALVPAYSSALRNNAIAAAALIVFCSLPFLFMQWASVKASNLGDSWVNRWSFVIPILLLSAITLVVLLYL